MTAPLHPLEPSISAYYPNSICSFFHKSRLATDSVHEHTPPHLPHPTAPPTPHRHHPQPQHPHNLHPPSTSHRNPPPTPNIPPSQPSGPNPPHVAPSHGTAPPRQNHPNHRRVLRHRPQHSPRIRAHIPYLSPSHPHSPTSLQFGDARQ